MQDNFFTTTQNIGDDVLLSDDDLGDDLEDEEDSFPVDDLEDEEDPDAVHEDSYDDEDGF